MADLPFAMVDLDGGRERELAPDDGGSEARARLDHRVMGEQPELDPHTVGQLPSAKGSLSIASRLLSASALHL